MARGKAIELFLIDGTPGGMITANIADWTGSVIIARRDQLSRLIQRDEAHSNGVYLLLGDDPAAIENTWCYIGKTENFAERLRTHDQRKSEWDRVVIISSLQSSFNEGHWGYMEKLLIDLARDAGRCSMPDNLQTPRTRRLSEGQRANVESFLDNVKLILPILGVNVLRSADAASAPTSEPAKVSELFYIHSESKPIDATLRLTDGEYFLLEGSTVAANVEVSGTTEASRRSYAAIAARHRKLLDDGSITVVNGHGLVTRDIAFTSSSSPAQIVLGRPANGRIEWKTADGTTLGEWEG